MIVRFELLLSFFLARSHILACASHPFIYNIQYSYLSILNGIGVASESIVCSRGKAHVCAPAFVWLCEIYFSIIIIMITHCAHLKQRLPCSNVCMGKHLQRRVFV